MRRNVAVLVGGLLLAVLGVPATPATAAAGTRCANVDREDGVTLARTCIAWDDKPDGSKWTLYQAKVWNPPGVGPDVIWALVDYNNGTGDGQLHTVGDGDTLILWTNGEGPPSERPYSVGPYTTKFDVWGPDAGDETFCMYMIPRGHNQEPWVCQG